MITPLEAQNKKFKKSVMGYSIDDVEEFYEKLVDDYEKLYKENIELKDKIETLDEAISYYKTLENGIEQTISQAQLSGEEIRANAYKQADNIVKEAEIKQREIIEQYNRDIIKKQQELEEMKKTIQIYRVKIEALLRTQLEILSDI